MGAEEKIEELKKDIGRSIENCKSTEQIVSVVNNSFEKLERFLMEINNISSISSMIDAKKIEIQHIIEERENSKSDNRKRNTNSELDNVDINNGNSKEYTRTQIVNILSEEDNSRETANLEGLIDSEMTDVLNKSMEPLLNIRMMMEIGERGLRSGNDLIRKLSRDDAMEIYQILQHSDEKVVDRVLEKYDEAVGIDHFKMGLKQGVPTQEEQKRNVEEFLQQTDAKQEKNSIELNLNCLE